MSSHTHDFLKEELTIYRVFTYFIAFVITFMFVDFFQVKATAQHGSFDQFNRHFAKTYPECIPQGPSDLFDCLLAWSTADEPDTRPDPMVSVVLWTDAMLKAASMSWPIRMEDHARVLETILPLQPKGVLVDLFFLDDPENRGDKSLQDLIDVLCDYQDASPGETPTTLYLTEPNPQSDPPYHPEVDQWPEWCVRIGPCRTEGNRQRQTCLRRPDARPGAHLFQGWRRSQDLLSRGRSGGFSLVLGPQSESDVSRK